MILKKIISSFLAVAMVAAMSTTVFAKDESVDESKKNTLVTYNLETGERTTQSVTEDATPNLPTAPTINWDSLDAGGETADGLVLNEEVDLGNDIETYNYTEPWTKVSNPKVWPYCAIARLEIAFPSGTVYATGVMVGPGKILTAAHCVLNTNGERATSITARFGKNGVGSTGVTSVTAYASAFTVSSLWANNMTGADYDYAKISVPTATNQYTGNYGYTLAADTSTNYTLSGYPWISGYKNEYMYTDSGTLVYTPNTNTIDHPFNSAASMSGSPIYQTGEQIIVGIHTWGSNESYNPGGTATRITQDVVNLIG